MLPNGWWHTSYCVSSATLLHSSSWCVTKLPIKPNDPEENKFSSECFLFPSSENGFLFLLSKNSCFNSLEIKYCVLLKADFNSISTLVLTVHLRVYLCQSLVADVSGWRLLYYHYLSSFCIYHSLIRLHYRHIHTNTHTQSHSELHLLPFYNYYKFLQDLWMQSKLYANAS